MTPEDILIESIAAASIHGDSAALRKKQILKLAASVEALVAWRLSEAQVRRDD